MAAKAPNCRKLRRESLISIPLRKRFSGFRGINRQRRRHGNCKCHRLEVPVRIVGDPSKQTRIDHKRTEGKQHDPLQKISLRCTTVPTVLAQALDSLFEQDKPYYS
jgi:hypothetical protein